MISNTNYHQFDGSTNNHAIGIGGSVGGVMDVPGGPGVNTHTGISGNHRYHHGHYQSPDVQLQQSKVNKLYSSSGFGVHSYGTTIFNNNRFEKYFTFSFMLICFTILFNL